MKESTRNAIGIILAVLAIAFGSFILGMQSGNGVEETDSGLDGSCVAYWTTRAQNDGADITDPDFVDFLMEYCKE